MARQKQDIPEGMEEFYVVADAITISMGTFVTKVGGAREEVVERLVQGETVIAPPDHPSVVEFLAMGGLVLKKDAKMVFEAAQKREGQHRPLVDRQDGMKGYRITALTAATMMADGITPGDVLTDVAPAQFEGQDPDLSFPGDDVEGLLDA
jgi:hypothetical protein